MGAPIDKRRYRYVLTLFTLQSETLMCTAHAYGPYTQGDYHVNKLFYSLQCVDPVLMIDKSTYFLKILINTYL